MKTAKGAHDFILNKEQALLMARTIKETAEKLAKPRTT